MFNFSPTSNSNDDVFTSCFRFLSVAVDHFSTASRAYFDAQKSLVWKVSGQTDITIEFNVFLNIYYNLSFGLWLSAKMMKYFSLFSVYMIQFHAKADKRALKVHLNV